VAGALPTGKQGGYADGADSSGRFSAIRAGDAIMIEEIARASETKAIVNALEQRFPGKAAPDQAAA
jgi:UDP-N-acetylmuramoyl-tripeptide--D-alanyl-D-alanine ligase